MAPGRLGVWLIGAGGNVATVFAVGWAALRQKLVPTTGLVSALPAFSGLPLSDPNEWVLGGHEIELPMRSADKARKLATAERLFDPALLPAIAGDLEAYDREVRPGHPAGDDGSAPEPAATVAALQRDLTAFRARHALDTIVVINVASTEPTPAAPLPDSLEALRAAIKAGARLPVSTLYAYAALDLGAAYVNFTPSPGASSAALDELAALRATVHAGSDGKTGETLMKTALAPMFALRNLRVVSWFGQNILGNADGRTLQDPAARGTKVGSKRDALPAILGYPLESHVGIDYVEALGDWKVAWNHILFDGFLGTRMSMQVIWQGADSILAAPLMIDLARFVDLARRRGERGLLGYLGFFFKRPLGSSEHRLDRQFVDLCAHFGAG